MNALTVYRINLVFKWSFTSGFAAFAGAMIAMCIVFGENPPVSEYFTFMALFLGATLCLFGALTYDEGCADSRKLLAKEANRC